MRKSIMIASVGLLSLMSCAQSNTSTSETTETTTSTTTTSTESVTSTTQTVENEIKRVTKAEFKEYLANHSNVQLIDIRTPSEFNAGYIEGAINIDYNNSNFEQKINELDKTKTVLIYCLSGGRSGRALKVFDANNFTTVLELEGGYSRW